MNTRRTASIVLALAVLAVGSAAYQAGANTLVQGSGDWADMAYYEENPDGPNGLHVRLFAWGTEYRQLVPPAEQGGLGDGGVCLDFGMGELVGVGCLNEGEWDIDSLASARVSDTVLIELRDESGAIVRTETATLDLTMTGEGLMFPGARARSNPSPGAELEYSITRAATVSGTVRSATLGVVDVTGRPAVLGRDSCVGLMTGEDHVEACRY